MQALSLNKRRLYYSNSRKNRARSDYNCWGVTQFVLGFADRLKWLDEFEMKRWLDIYTEKIYRPKKSGDILVVYDMLGTYYWLKHTAIYLGNGKYFHKQGSCVAEITTLEGIKETYSGKLDFLRIK